MNTDLTPALIEKMLAHVGPVPDPTFGDVAYDDAGYVEAYSIADTILAEQRTRTEAVDPDTEALRLLTLLVDPDGELSDEDRAGTIRLAWWKAVKRFESKLNDAELLGTETPAFVSILDQPATLMTGELWGAKDRRNTQDGDWKPVTLSWREWINGGAGTNNAPAWGFSRHPVGKYKEGACIILGASVEGSCNAKDMATMAAIGVDFDSGVELDDLIDKVEAEGLLCLIYTSYSHGKTTLELKRDAVIQRRKIKGAPTIEDVRNYLRYDDKDQYSEEFLSKIEIAQDKKQVKGGVVIVLQTPPQVKVRAIFPLASPVKLIDLAETHSAALDLWTDKTTGFASKVLGFPFDTSCTDAGRRFYTARHSKDAKWDCVVIRGNPLDFDSIPVVRKQTYLDARKAGGGENPYLTAGGVGAGYSDRATVLAPSGLSLSEWHSKAKERFKITEVIEDHCREQVRSGSGDKIYIHCPFGDHDAGGETSTYAKNPDHTADDDKGRYWTIRCSHDTCQGRHKLDFLAEMLRQQWFEEDQLFGDTVYMLKDPDDVQDGEKETPSLDPAAPLGRTAKQKLASLSARFKLVNYKGKVLVIRNIDRAGMLAGDDILEFWTKPALKEFYAHEAWPEEVGEGKNKKTHWVNPVDRWWTDEAKRHSRVVFDPSERPREYDVNLYNKDLLTLVPAPGDSTPIQDFIRDVICGGDVSAYNWVTLYLAHMIQRPAERPGTALVLYGPGGVGKGTFGRIARRLVEPYDLLATHPEHLLGRFAGPSLATSMCVVSEEAVFGKSAEAADQLKGMVTQSDMRVEAKQVQSVQMDVFFRIIIDSNHDAAVRIEGNNSERRYMVLNVGTSMQGDRDAFKTLYQQIEGPAMAAYAAWLRQWVPASAGLDWSDVRTAPVTAARKQMFVESLRGSDKAFLRMLEDSEFVWRDGGHTFRIVLGEGENRVPARALDDWVRALSGRYESDLRPAAAVWKRLFGEELDRPKPARVAGERQTLDEGAADAEYAWQPFSFNTSMYHLPGLGVILDMIRHRTGRLAEVEN